MNARTSVRKPWSLEEDMLLLKLVKENGAVGYWPKIALAMERRTGKQCRERYINHLDPDMKKTPWNDEENNAIRDLFPKYGTKWSQYLTALPGRSDNAIKNRYHLISRNNFECCSKRTGALFLKRSHSEPSCGESDADTSKEDTSAGGENRRQLNMLIAARGELDREILELENTLQQSAPKDAVSSPSNSEMYAEFADEPPCFLDSEYNFDFEWTDEISMMAAT
eukprot:gene7557-9054_t